MKVVRFPSGDFAIRKWSIAGPLYYDLKARLKGNHYWWSRNSEYFPDCMDASVLHVLAVMEELRWWRHPVANFRKRFGEPLSAKRQQPEIGS